MNTYNHLKETSPSIQYLKYISSWKHCFFECLKCLNQILSRLDKMNDCLVVTTIKERKWSGHILLFHLIYQINENFQEEEQNISLVSQELRNNKLVTSFFILLLLCCAVLHYMLLTAFHEIQHNKLMVISDRRRIESESSIS